MPNTQERRPLSMLMGSQEIKEDSVVVDDVFGEGITHAIVPLEHADGVTTCAPTGSQRRIHVPPPSRSTDNLR